MLGDQRGAGGIDSNHYSYLINNWNWSTSKKPSKFSLDNGRSRRTRYIRRSRAIVNKKPTKILHKVKRKIISSAINDGVKKKVKKIKYQPDSIDREAIRNMRSLRVKWTDSEDHILKVVKAAHIMLNPSPLDFLLLQVAKIMRDIIRQTLGHQKTSMACLRRIQYIIKEKKTTYSEIQSIICEFQKHPQVLRVYNTDFVNQLKFIYKNKDQLSNAIAVHILLLCGHYLYLKEAGDADDPYGNRRVVPRTIDDFFAEYSEYIVMTEKHYILHAQPLTIEDAQVYALNNLIHSVLCSTKDKRNYSTQLLSIYKEYPESILQRTLTKIKDDQMAVKLKRRLHHSTKMADITSSGLTYIFSSKYKQMLQFTKIPYAVFDKEYTSLKAWESSDTRVIKSPDLGELFLLAEMNFDKRFRITSLKLPKKILTVDNTIQHNLVSEPERILEHFRQIFANSPKTLYLAQFETENKQSPSKMQKSNEKCSMKADPFDDDDLEGTEHDTSLNKEQKLLKAQDIFVINLPEIVLQKDKNFTSVKPNENLINSNLVR